MKPRRVTITNVTDEPSPALERQRLVRVPIQVGEVQISPGESASVRERDLSRPHIARLIRLSALVYGERVKARAPSKVDHSALKPLRDDPAPPVSEPRRQTTRAERRAQAKLRREATAPTPEPPREEEAETASSGGDGDG